MFSVSDRGKNILYFGASTAIIVALILFADVEKFLNSIATADTTSLAISIVAGIAVFFVFGFTWHRFLEKIGLNINYIESFKLFLSGQFMNSVTPLGQLGGEPVMAYVIKDNQDTSYEKALSAVVSADIINTIPYITFLIGGTGYLLFFDSVNQTVGQSAVAATVMMVGGSVLAYLLWFRAEKLEKAANRFLDFLHQKTGWSRFSGLEESISEIRSTLDSIGENPRYLMTTAVVAHLAFGFQIVSLFFALSSIGESIGLTSIYFVIAVSSLANFSPTPGGSGTFEAAMAGILTSLSGLGFADALTVSILYRLATYWSGLLIGYVAILSLRKSGKVDREDLEEDLGENS